MNLYPAVFQLPGHDLRQCPVSALQHPDAEGMLSVRKHGVDARCAEGRSSNIEALQGERILKLFIPEILADSRSQVPVSVQADHQRQVSQTEEFPPACIPRSRNEVRP